MSDIVECPNCGYEIGDNEEDNEEVITVVGECVECGKEIVTGEWHVVTNCETERIPDNTQCQTVMGNPSDCDRICKECSEYELEQFPDA